MKTQVFRSLFVALCLITLVMGSASLASAADVNLALGKPCTVVTGGTLGSSKLEWMVDGNITTMWRTSTSGSPKIHTGIVSCDLGDAMTINRIVVTEYKQKSVNMVIKVSTDGSNWTEVANQNFQAIGSDHRRSEFTFTPQQARYVQVEAKDAVYAFGIYELEVYSPSAK